MCGLDVCSAMESHPSFVMVFLWGFILSAPSVRTIALQVYCATQGLRHELPVDDNLMVSTPLKLDAVHPGGLILLEQGPQHLRGHM